MRIFCIILAFCFTTNLIGNNQSKIDSLLVLIEQSQNTLKLVDLQNDLSWEYRNINPENAFELLDSSLAIAKNFGYNIGIAKNHLLRGAILTKVNLNDSAIVELKIAKQHYEKLKNKDKTASCIYNIGAAYNQKGEFKQSITYFKQALEIYKSLKITQRISSCLFNIGVLSENLNKYEQAIDYYTQALNIDIEIKDSVGIATGFSNIGNVYENWANFLKAIEYYQKAEEIFNKTNNTEGLAYCYNNKGNVYSEWGNYNKAIEYYQKALEINYEFKDSVTIAGILTNIASIYNQWGDFKSALNYYNEAKQIASSMKNKPIIVICYSGIGDVYLNKGNYDLAIPFYQDALTINKQLKDRSAIADSYLDIGNIHELWGNFDTAIKYYNEALNIYKDLNELNGNALSLFMLGSVYNQLDILEKANDFFVNAMDISKQINNNSLTANCLHYLGLVYAKQKKYRIALYHLTEGLKLLEELNEQGSIASILVSMGEINSETGKYKKAFKYYEKAKDIGLEIGKKRELSLAYQGLAICYEKFNNPTKALINYKQHKIYNDSLYDIKSKMTLNQVESKFELENKQQKIELQRTQLASKDLELKQQRIFRNILIAGVLVACIIIIIVIFVYLQKQKNHKLIVRQKNEIIEKNRILEENEKKITLQNVDLQQQNNEILVQRDEIEKQQNKLLLINAQVTNSINYAERIQRSMLPDTKLLTDNLKDHFIFYKPRDVVSGDFYWIKKINNLLIISAVDSTGHGVPGAFMSMLGMSFLNEIVSKGRINNTNEILDRLREKVKKALKQKGAIGETRDGMDMALIILNIETKELQYSGAHNPLYVVRNNELLLFKADKQPIAIYEKETPFNAQNIQLQNNDCLYLFTDGYADQYGGPEQKKFMSRQFRELLLGIHEHSFALQKKILNQTFEDWRNGYEQMDDLLVIGLKV